MGLFVQKAGGFLSIQVYKNTRTQECGIRLSADTVLFFANGSSFVIFDVVFCALGSGCRIPGSSPGQALSGMTGAGLWAAQARCLRSFKLCSGLSGLHFIYISNCRLEAGVT